ncbi:MAG: hypothetical protein ABR556_14475, partial [Pyrinomonadaceae bacterium]
MKRSISLLLVLILATLTTASPLLQQPAQNQTQTATELTNKDVLDMVKAGLATEIIVAKIKATPSKFDTSASPLAELKAAGIPDAVVMAMVQGPGGAPLNSGPPAPEAAVKV